MSAFGTTPQGGPVRAVVVVTEVLEVVGGVEVGLAPGGTGEELHEASRATAMGARSTLGRRLPTTAASPLTLPSFAPACVVPPACPFARIYWHPMAPAGILLRERDQEKHGAGDGNRTRMTSLEGWDSAIELRPRL